ncbi:MAG: hypothetical protein M1283_02960 [Gammaproteobacteria bacterium]|nr:hypothetical protein [Gammaproteobacteria bacterium]
MTIGLLIITHNNIGTDLVETATGMLGVCPLATYLKNGGTSVYRRNLCIYRDFLTDSTEGYRL